MAVPQIQWSQRTSLGVHLLSIVWVPFKEEGAERAEQEQEQDDINKPCLYSAERHRWRMQSVWVWAILSIIIISRSTHLLVIYRFSVWFKLFLSSPHLFNKSCFHTLEFGSSERVGTIKAPLSRSGWNAVPVIVIVVVVRIFMIVAHLLLWISRSRSDPEKRSRWWWTISSPGKVDSVKN